MGAVLAFAATGEQPFGTGSPDVRNQRVLYLAPRLDNLPDEVRPLVERCMARDPADRPTASQFLANLVAAHPEAVGQADWLPERILAEARRRIPPPPPVLGTPPREETAALYRKASPPADPTRTSTSVPAPPVAASPVNEPRRRFPQRRRIWAIGGIAVVAVLGMAVGLLVAPSGSSSARSGLPIPGTSRSVPSATVVASTAAQPALLADAAFNWGGIVNYKETASSDSYFKKVGAAWQDDWSVSSNCAQQPCAKATLDGAINGITFTATLARSGATYTGSAPIDNYWLDCLHTSHFENTTLAIKLTATRAGPVPPQGLSITAFTGTVIWNVPYLPDGCAGSLYQMRVNGSTS